jgi:hypothetical protein
LHQGKGVITGNFSGRQRFGLLWARPGEKRRQKPEFRSQRLYKYKVPLPRLAFIEFRSLIFQEAKIMCE